MLSLPDFKEKQLLLINSDEWKKLALKNDNLIIKDEQENKIIFQLSVYKIFTIFVIGDFSITTKLVNRLLDFGVSIYTLWYNLKPKFVINSPLEWNYLLRQKQYNFPYELDYAKQLIFQKTTNQLKLLQNIRKKSDEVKQAIKKIKSYIAKIETVDNEDSLRWIEWNVAKIYFQTYFSQQWWFMRAPRTKIDIINVLMDIGYTYLFHFIEANLNLYGFDIYKGVFHKQFRERKSLVTDLQEPFRPIIDKTIKNMYNLWQVDEKDFKIKQGRYILPYKNHKKYSQVLLEAIIKYKESIFKYVRWFYLAMMKEEKTIPVFKI